MHYNIVYDYPSIMNRRGIILAGGTGSRLFPSTIATCKQLLPIYDKPMIYYPLSTLMLAGIREIRLITTPKDHDLFLDLLGNGSELGIELSYAIQPKPNGLAEAFLICSDFITNHKSALILGDNLFHGDELISKLSEVNSSSIGASIFAYQVHDPERYGVVEFNKSYKAISIEEKPKNCKSNYAITGLYFYDESVVERSEKLVPSKRGELEITDLNISYLNDELLHVNIFSRGMAWLDTGTHESLNDATNYIRTIENRQGLKVSCPEEIAWRNKWISDNELEKIASKYEKSNYGKYLLNLL